MRFRSPDTIPCLLFCILLLALTVLAVGLVTGVDHQQVDNRQPSPAPAPATAWR